MFSIPFNEHKSLPDISAVYIIKSFDEVLYIGSSVQIRTRILYHNKKNKFKNAILIEYIPCEPEELGKIEAIKIKELLPTLNTYAFNYTQKRKNIVNYSFKNESDKNTTLRDKTLHLLNSRLHSLTLKKISEDTQIQVGWLSIFSRGKIFNPGVNTIQALYQYLTNTEIKV